MSTFDDASLVFIPSGYKTSKAYSVKPSDGSGDLTFSRSNDTATRVNSAGLIEKVRTNLFLYSEQFNNTAAWQYQGGATISANASVAPDGTTTADLLYPSINNSVVAAIQAITSASSVEYTQSVYVKASGKNFAALYTFNGTTGTTMWVNLTTGEITNGVGANVSNRFATNVGNGWWRIGFTDIGNGTTTYMHVYPTDAASSNSVTASGTNGILLWGAQLETGPVATPYIATTSAAVSVGPVANVPRLDYLGSSCPRLLLEPQRTNLALYSEQLDNAAWQKSTGGTGVVPVVTANNAISPDGYQNADTVFFNAGAGTTPSDQSAIYQTFGSLPAGTYTGSFYAKTASGTAQIMVRHAGGGNYTKFTITDQWQRFTSTEVAPSTSTQYFEMTIRRGLNEPINASATIQLWGIQLEAGAYATSYIPTLGAAVTRGADAASKTGISSLIGQTEGVLYIECDIKAVSELSRLLFVSDGTLNNFINIYVDSDNKIYATTRLSASTVSLFASNTLTAGTYKIAYAYKANDFILYINGTAVSGSSSANIPATSRLDIGSRLTSSSYFNSFVNQAILFPTRLSNADLAALTTI